ncbi:MAG: energy transducer TonB [Proteobacteria bacterium]|nr:energy transducer TonB [Pseudomonadota bacterium]
MARYGMAIPLAVLFTLAVFFLMHTLIETGRSAITEETGGAVVDFVRVQQDENVRQKDRQPERPPEPEKPPPQPDIPAPQLAQTMPGNGLNIGSMTIEADIDVSAGIDSGAAGGEYLPIVKVAPIYPQRALARGLEGWVLVEFTVTATGTVRDARVVESDPPGVFDRAAVEAAMKFKYKPRVIDGRATDVDGVRNIVRFELER